MFTTADTENAEAEILNSQHLLLAIMEFSKLVIKMQGQHLCVFRDKRGLGCFRVCTSGTNGRHEEKNSTFME
jgi:hypothetical protein